MITLYSASFRKLLTDLALPATSWSVSRPSGDGVTAARAYAPAGTVTLYVLRMTAPGLRELAAQWPHLTADWWGVGAQDLDLLAYDQVSASGDSFGVQAVDAESWPGYLVAPLKRLT